MANISELALDYERKRERLEMLGMMNIKTIREERDAQAIQYHQAEADVLKAWNALVKAKMEYAS